MGMFDYINHQVNCPECGSVVDSFQSKDGVCMLSSLEFWEVDRFYDSCDSCGAWIEYYIKPQKRQKLEIDDYEMSCRSAAELKKGLDNGA